jgi:DNA-binding MarR family transcriptional regulator
MRMATRSISAIYDRQLRPLGLRTSQLAVLWGVYGTEPVTASELATTMAIDKTTLARALRVLEENELISMVPGRDRRERRAALTRKGRAKFDDAMPLWRAAQDEVRATVGEGNFNALVAISVETTRAL